MWKALLTSALEAFNWEASLATWTPSSLGLEAITKKAKAKPGEPQWRPQTC